MADFVSQANGLLGWLRSDRGQAPSPPQLAAVTNAAPYRWPGAWTQLLNNAASITGGRLPDSAVNPSNASDLLDIGTLTLGEVFVAHTQPTKDKFLALHLKREVRRFLFDNALVRGVETEVLSPGQGTGKPLDQVRADVTSVVRTRLLGALGDESTETE